MLSSHADTSHINHDFGWRGRGKKEKKEGWGEEEEEQGGRSPPFHMLLLLRPRCDCRAAAPCRDFKSHVSGRIRQQFL